jgi:hypothetical protein
MASYRELRQMAVDAARVRFEPGARVQNIRTSELATVVARDPGCPASCTTVEYDGDEGNVWNTSTYKLEIIGSVEDMEP